MQAFSNHRTSCISPASQDRSDREWKSMEPIIELYHSDLSSCAQKVRIALYEKQLPWKSHHLNLRKGAQLKPEYMKLNPNGVVPTLVNADRGVIASNVILAYIEDTFQEPSLRPSTTADLRSEERRGG